MAMGIKIKKWIENYFLKVDWVFVSEIGQRKREMKEHSRSLVCVIKWTKMKWLEIVNPEGQMVSKERLSLWF